MALCFYDNITQAQIGIGTINPNSSSLLELRSDSLGFLPPRMNTNERANIISPAQGLVIFNTITKCLEWYTGSNWVSLCTNSTGTLNCSNSSVHGTCQALTALNSNNYLSVEVSVTQIGAWSIRTNIVNGCWFQGSGVFTSIGVQTITLFGYGTPYAFGQFNYTTIFGTSSCNFGIMFNEAPTGNGVLNCSSLNAHGIYNAGQTTNSSHYISIDINVSTAGTFLITTNTNNGVSFSSRTLTLTLGTHTIYLYASGTSILPGDFGYTVSYGASSCTTLITYLSSSPLSNFVANNTIICEASEVQFTDLSSNNPTSWSWTFTGGTPPTSTLQNPLVTYNTAGNYSVSLIATNSSGSDNETRNGYIVVNTIPAQPGIIGGNIVVCNGTANTYSISSVPGAISYTWTYSGIGTPSGIGTSCSLVPTSNGTLSVTANNNCGSSSVKSISISVASGIPSQAGIISGNINVCSRTTNTYSITSVSGATSYTWSYTGTGTLIGSETSCSLTPSSSGILRITANNVCGISPIQSLSINVTSAIPSQPGIISGNIPVCSGTINTYSITAVAEATSYTWTYSGTGSPSGTGNTCSLSPTSSGTLSVTANNICGNSIARTLSVTVTSSIPVQPGAINGNSPVCTATSNTYSIVAVTGATSYTWTYSGVGTPNGTGTSCTLVPTSSGNLNVTANNVCGNSTPNALSITVISGIPTQPGLISGNNSVCSGTTNTYSISAVSGATSYTWTYSGIGTPVGTGVSCSLTPTSSGILSVKANNICGSSSTNTLSINVVSGIPSQPGTISGNTYVCNSSTNTYSITAVSGATSYTWTYSGIGIPSGSGVSCTLTPTGSGTISVTANNVCGISTPRTLAITSIVCVSCGTQIWAGTNVNVGTRIVGTTEQTNNGIVEKYCFNNLESNCDIYGGLYQWAETMQYKNGCSNSTWLQPTQPVQGICPSGWHVPSSTEWTTLVNCLGGVSVAGGKLKEVGLAHWSSPNGEATNQIGFTALPGCAREPGGSFSTPGFDGYYWNSNEDDASNPNNPTYASAVHLGCWNGSIVNDMPYPKVDGFSVRCIKD